MVPSLSLTALRAWRVYGLQLSMLAWAYATAGHWSPELFGLVGRVSLFTATYFTLPNLANIAYAYGSLGVPSALLLRSLSESFVKRRNLEMIQRRLHSPEDLAALAWGFAAADHPDGPRCDLLTAISSQRSPHSDLLTHPGPLPGLLSAHASPLIDP